ncbi:MAG: class I SAM-dependent methyltransferase [Flavobacteriales bacterium]|nr:class I SAM-dependent methyltransferase [Flavobacteriales bacterium]
MQDSFVNKFFDKIAEAYDRDFTYSEIGKLQRGLVWDYMDQLDKGEKLRILELNCGTGEDAVWFAKKGHTVLASDASGKMVKVTQKKVLKNKLENQIVVQCINIEELTKKSFKQKFDLVYSNFGGFNCIDEDYFDQLSAVVRHYLRPGGHFVTVVMPRYCIWESLYFIYKRDFKSVFRRLKSKVVVNYEGALTRTNYYNPGEFYDFFKSRFVLKAKKPIGLFIPPSYLEKFFKNRPKALKILLFLEKRLGFNFMSAFADHYLIHLTKK